MTDNHAGRNLFVVDNSVSGWTGLRYLEEWTEIAKAMDIATGFFEIGALLALDKKWQHLDKIRVLMGAESTQRTRRVLLDSVRNEAVSALDKSLDASKKENPFLEGVPAILQALQDKQIECRVYDRNKFHAKAYITHSKLEVVGSQALVGSSNFTKPGLTQNIELNVQIQSAREVAQLQEWFEIHWNDGQDITPVIVDTVERHARAFTPFEVYAKALQEFFRSHQMTANEWDETQSTIFRQLDQYQREGYWTLMQIARRHGGAFLCDGVGLGKTFIGLMLIERLIVHENKRVALFAPKAAREAVWEPHIRRWLPDIGGVAGEGDFSNLVLFNHTDLSRGEPFPAKLNRVAKLADVVIIDEAHHFRNPGSRGNKEKQPSRYYRLYDLLDQAKRPKTLFMLTATPINNRLSDFRHMVELFSRRDEAYFSRTLAINNLKSHIRELEKAIEDRLGHRLMDIADELAEAQDVLAADVIFSRLVVQRSRSYVRKSQSQLSDHKAIFPDRAEPQVAAYSIRKTYGQLLQILEAAFERERPLFTLPMYYPLFWWRGDSDDQGIDPLEQNRQKQVVGLIRTSFLKRFESSVRAFEISCGRLLTKLLAFLEVHSETASEKERLERWKAQNQSIISYANSRRVEIWGDGDDEDSDEDVVPPEMLDDVERLDRKQYEVEEMLDESFSDMDQIVKFLQETKEVKAEHDDKLHRLIRLLKSPELAGKKVLVFTEFADTARYLRKQLEQAGISGVAQVDGGTKTNRADIIRRFSPYYNGSSSAELASEGQKEITVLISTDVLSEGLNLQDASRMINYDIHWNPVRLMQRIGRVDRRMNAEVEKQLIADNPDVKESRGKVIFWNFLPPEDLNPLLSLYAKVTKKTLLISKTFGIEGKKLLTPEDNYDALKSFNQAYEGSRSKIENMQLQYQALLKEHPELKTILQDLPVGIFSGRNVVKGGRRGVFFCYALPALDKDKGSFTEEAGTARWYFYDCKNDKIYVEPTEIVKSIRSKPDTPRKCITPPRALVDIRDKIENQIKNTYLKRVNAPIGVWATLKCWMEVGGG